MNITEVLSLGLKTINKDKIRMYWECFSITSILSVLADDPQIAIWKQTVWEEQAEKVLEEARSRWTHIHNMIENHYLWTCHTIPLDDKKILACFTWFNTFLATHWSEIEMLEVWGNKCIEQELKSESEWIAWRYDMVCKWWWKITLIDFKTSSSARLTGITLEKYLLQTCIYAYMFSLQTWIKVEQVKLIPLTYNRKSGLWEIETVDNTDVMYEYVKNFFTVFYMFKQSLNQ